MFAYLLPLLFGIPTIEAEASLTRFHRPAVTQTAEQPRGQIKLALRLRVVRGEPVTLKSR